MLGSLSASEYAAWVAFFGETPFSQQLLDAEFATTKALIVSVFAGNHDAMAEDFSLLCEEADSPEVEISDDELMVAAEGMSGGVRYGPGSE